MQPDQGCRAPVTQLSLTMVACQSAHAAALQVPYLAMYNLTGQLGCQLAFAKAIQMSVQCMPAAPASLQTSQTGRSSTCRGMQTAHSCGLPEHSCLGAAVSRFALPGHDALHTWPMQGRSNARSAAGD